MQPQQIKGFLVYFLFQIKDEENRLCLYLPKKDIDSTCILVRIYLLQKLWSTTSKNHNTQSQYQSNFR